MQTARIASILFQLVALGLILYSWGKIGPEEAVILKWETILLWLIILLKDIQLNIKGDKK